MNEPGAAFVPLPDWAEIIFSAPCPEEIGPLGIAPVELFVTDAEGRPPVRITNGGWQHNHFAVSTDRRYIAVNRIVGDTNGDGSVDLRDHKQLHLLDMHDGTDSVLAPELDAGWGGIAWSPDSGSVYASCSTPGRFDDTDICRIPLDGAPPERLTAELAGTLYPTASGKWVSDVDISPDGEWMCFILAPAYDGQFLPKTSVALARVDGSAPRLLTDGGSLPPEKRGYFSVGDFDPEFNPDGTRIVFSRMTAMGMNDNVSSADIIHVDISGTDLAVVTPVDDPATKGIPSWADDGRILFMVIDEAGDYRGPGIIEELASYRRLSGIVGSHFQWLPECT